ncbi:hypothetical protein, partial [Xanthobacter wiegelii]|uniref:hypothetical protein n=1 Tax=Xanthobacter wiegelii TaxID=3119913 RepID=UPI003729C444
MSVKQVPFLAGNVSIRRHRRSIGAGSGQDVSQSRHSSFTCRVRHSIRKAKTDADCSRNLIEIKDLRGLAASGTLVAPAMAQQRVRAECTPRPAASDALLPVTRGAFPIDIADERNGLAPIRAVVFL